MEYLLWTGGIIVVLYFGVMIWAGLGLVNHISETLDQIQKNTNGRNETARLRRGR